MALPKQVRDDVVRGEMVELVRWVTDRDEIESELVAFRAMNQPSQPRAESRSAAARKAGAKR